MDEQDEAIVREAASLRGKIGGSLDTSCAVGIAMMIETPDWAIGRR